MSRIGKMPITVPAGVEMTVDGNTVTVKGPKGELTRTFSSLMTVKQDGNTIIVERPDDSREAKSMHGLTRSLLNNMVIGVSTGFSKKLVMVGVEPLCSICFTKRPITPHSAPAEKISKYPLLFFLFIRKRGLRFSPAPLASAARRPGLIPCRGYAPRF